MKKKLLAMLSVSSLVLSMGVTAYAATPARYMPSSAVWSQTDGYGFCGNGFGYGFMFDEDGAFLSEEAIESKLDIAVQDGVIQEEDKDFYLEMYEYCTTNIGAMMGSGRGCCGRRYR